MIIFKYGYVSCTNCATAEMCSKYNAGFPYLLEAALFVQTEQRPKCQTSSAPMCRYCMSGWKCTICRIRDFTKGNVLGLDGQMELGKCSTSLKDLHSLCFKTNWNCFCISRRVSYARLVPASYTSMWPNVCTKGTIAKPQSPAICNMCLASWAVYPLVKWLGPLLPMWESSRLYGNVSSHSRRRPVAPHVLKSGNNCNVDNSCLTTNFNKSVSAIAVDVLFYL